jgi:hypothetical protein
VKALALRIGLYRVAAVLVGCALLLEVLRVGVLAGVPLAQILCTLGEVLFVALGLAVFVIARRRRAAS